MHGGARCSARHACGRCVRSQLRHVCHTELPSCGVEAIHAGGHACSLPRAPTTVALRRCVKQAARSTCGTRKNCNASLHAGDEASAVACATAEAAVRAGAAQSGVTFDTLGGIDDVARALHELVVLPMTQPDLFRRFGVKPPGGVLLHGPPGSGKTVLARAAAHESGATLLASALLALLHALQTPCCAPLPHLLCRGLTGSGTPSVASTWQVSTSWRCHTLREAHVEQDLEVTPHPTCRS